VKPSLLLVSFFAYLIPHTSSLVASHPHGATARLPRPQSAMYLGRPVDCAPAEPAGARTATVAWPQLGWSHCLLQHAAGRPVAQFCLQCTFAADAGPRQSVSRPASVSGPSRPGSAVRTQRAARGPQHRRRPQEGRKGPVLTF